MIFAVLVGLAISSAVRFYFLIAHGSGSYAVGELIRSFVIGLRFDSMILAYGFIPLLLTLLLQPSKRLLKFFVEPWLGFVFGTIIVAGIVDVEYYRYFNSHLSLWAIDYLEDPQIVLYLISSSYGIVLTLLLAVMAYVAGFVVSRLLRPAYPVDEKKLLRWRLVQFAVFALLTAIAARGSLSIAPGDWGMAYFSDDQFLNQLSLNGLYTLMKTVQEIGNSSRYHLSTDEEAIVEARRVFHSQGDSLLDVKGIRRISDRSSGNVFAAGRYNVVIIVLESWAKRFVSAYGEAEATTPCFDSLMAENILFENYFASGSRSVNGLTAVLFGFPTAPGRSIMKRYIAEKPYMSVAQSLEPYGYRTMFLYGGDISFDNMGGSFRDAGFDRVMGQQSFSDSLSIGKWGVPDGPVFQRFLSEIDTMGRPFCASMFTLTSHDPFDLPEDYTPFMEISDRESGFLATIHYSDSCLGEFFVQARNRPWFDSTIFIFTADHGVSVKSQFVLDPRRYEIAGGMILPPQLREFIVDTLGLPQKLNVAASQTDLLPSLYDLLGLSIEHRSHGGSIFDTTRTGLAVIGKSRTIALCTGDSMFIYDIDSDTQFLLTYKEKGWQTADFLRKDCEIATKYNTLKRIMQFAIFEMGNQEIAGDI